MYVFCIFFLSIYNIIYRLHVGLLNAAVVLKWSELHWMANILFIIFYNMLYTSISNYRLAASLVERYILCCIL